MFPWSVNKKVCMSLGGNAFCLYSLRTLEKIHMQKYFYLHECIRIFHTTEEFSRCLDLLLM